MKQLKKYIDRLPKFLRNKYSLTILAFVIWVSFYANNDLLTQFSQIKKERELDREIVRMKNQIAETKESIKELTTDQALLEKYAREKYLMKKDDEDIFYIVKE